MNLETKEGREAELGKQAEMLRNDIKARGLKAITSGFLDQERTLNHVAASGSPMAMFAAVSFSFWWRELVERATNV